MIVSTNPKPSLGDFKNLMRKTDYLLNEDALSRPKYYASRGGKPLEDDVKEALEEARREHNLREQLKKCQDNDFQILLLRNSMVLR